MWLSGFFPFLFFFFPQLQGMCNLSSQHRDGTHVPRAGSAESSPLDLQGSLLLVLDWNSTLTNHDLLHGEKWRCQESLSHIFTSRSLESPLPCRLTFWLKTVKCYPDLFSESCSYLSFSSSWFSLPKAFIFFFVAGARDDIYERMKEMKILILPQ